MPFEYFYIPTTLSCSTVVYKYCSYNRTYLVNHFGLVVLVHTIFEREHYTWENTPLSRISTLQTQGIPSMKMHARKFGSLPRVHIYLSAAYTCLVPVFQKCSFRRFRHLLSDDYDDVCNFMGVLDLFRPICILADTEILLNTCLFAVILNSRHYIWPF